MSKWFTVIADNFIRVKISYFSICRLLYALSFRTARAMSHALILVYVHGFRMLLISVLSAKIRSTVWCSEIGSLPSLDAPEFHASGDIREPISLHHAVYEIKLRTKTAAIAVYTAWCSEIGSTWSLDAPELHASVTSENQFHCTKL